MDLRAPLTQNLEGSGARRRATARHSEPAISRAPVPERWSVCGSYAVVAGEVLVISLGASILIGFTCTRRVAGASQAAVGRLSFAVPTFDRHHLSRTWKPHRNIRGGENL
jgi:hypothetical protein